MLNRSVLYIILFGIVLSTFPATAEESSPGLEISPGKSAGQWPRDLSPVHMVVVFTKFKGEAPGDSLAPSWADQIFSGEPGSVTHYFDEMSFGQYDVSGEYLPKRYELPHPSEYYTENRTGYALDLVEILDADPSVNFTKFDNDGPDGIPGSSDDDHFVDYLVFMPKSRPYNFINKYATGVWTTGLIDVYYTNEHSSDGFLIKIDKFSGCISTANSLNEAVGTIVAEISHAYGKGTIEKKKKIWDDPESDSAGVGYWCILGKGALGWEERGGPIGPNAYNRWRMDSIGYNNVNIVDLAGFNQNVRMKSSGESDGVVYRIWINEQREEYYLLEYRRNDTFYYDRYIPENGLLIWHVLGTETNNNELMKLCDLECPDGRYLDAGYPLGKKPDPLNGGDNLDFWAHDTTYTIEYEGNAGDSFDVYDGVRYTKFGADTNPNSFSKMTRKETGIEIFNIHQEGKELVFDCIVPPYHNWFEERYPFIGSGFQRFYSAGEFNTYKPAAKEVYLVRTDDVNAYNSLVIIDGARLTIEPLYNFRESEIVGLLRSLLVPDNEPGSSSLLTRTNIPLDTFYGILSSYRADFSDVGNDAETLIVQKVTNITNNQIQPQQLILQQNMPNPFNSMTTIQYALPTPGNVSLDVYNVAGQKVMVIEEGFKGIGYHSILLDAGDLASGVYLYRLNGPAVFETQKFTLIR